MKDDTGNDGDDDAGGDDDRDMDVDAKELV
jgi:hypothetical protein